MKREILRDKALDWFERIFFSALLDKTIKFFLIFVMGWFLGYLYFRFQLPY